MGEEKGESKNDTNRPRGRPRGSRRKKSALKGNGYKRNLYGGANEPGDDDPQPPAPIVIPPAPIVIPHPPPIIIPPNLNAGQVQDLGVLAQLPQTRQRRDARAQV